LDIDFWNEGNGAVGVEIFELYHIEKDIWIKAQSIEDSSLYAFDIERPIFGQKAYGSLFQTLVADNDLLRLYKMLQLIVEQLFWSEPHEKEYKKHKIEQPKS